MTHNHSLFRSLCTQRWTRACSLAPEAPSFWLAFQARPAICMHVFVKVQCSTLGSTPEDKCFSFFSTDWRWQWWRTSNSAVTAFIAKRPRVAYSCSYVLLVLARVHKNKSRQLHTMGSVTAEFEVRHRWRTTTLFSGRYALIAEHVHARSLQKLHLFDWHFRLGLHFACTCSSKYSVQRVQRSRIKMFYLF